MSKENYISEEIEEIITKDIFEKYFKNLQIEGDVFILNKMTIELFRLKIRLIKYFKGSVILIDLEKFNLEIILLKLDKILSEIEIQDFENFLKMLNDKSTTLKEEACYLYMISQLSESFHKEQESIYEKIIMLEEKNRINSIIEHF